MLVDANVLLYAADSSSRFHGSAARWLEAALNGPARVAFPWPVLTAFLRIATNPRALEHPLAPYEAWQFVDEWLASDPAWIPLPTARHGAVYRSLVVEYDLRGDLVADAHLAALAIEHGLAVCSTDSDFARFRELRWINPLA